MDDAGDNCPLVYNPEQEDGHGNGIGDACEDPSSVDGRETENAEALHLQIVARSPASGTTTIRYALPRGTSGEITIHAVNGVLLRRLEGVAGGDLTSISWDGRDQTGRRLEPGICLIRLESSAGSRANKIVRY